jgi:hypothetical protein
MPQTQVSAGSELWVHVPPGWIELAAFAGDAEALAWFGRLLDETPDLFAATARAELMRTYAAVRSQVDHGLVDSAGTLVTTLPDDTVTIWQFTLRVVDLPPSGDVNPMAVVQRFLAAEQAGGTDELGTDDLVEEFRTEDGRDGVAIHTTAPAGENGPLLLRHVPHADPAALGVVYAAVRLHRSSGGDFDRLAVVTGVAPTVAERLPMALVAAQLTLSARLRNARSDPPPGPVAVDAADVTSP